MPQMPLKPKTLSSIVFITSRLFTTTGAAKATSTTTLKAAVSQPPPASSTISQHFVRIISLWPSDPLRPANLSFKEYIKARAALARSNNHLSYENQDQTTTSSSPSSSSSSTTTISRNQANTTEQQHDHDNNVSFPTCATSTFSSASASTSADSPHSRLTAQNHETSDAEAEAQPRAADGHRPGMRISDSDLQVLSAFRLETKGAAGEAATAAETDAGARNGRAREAELSAGNGDSATGATAEATTATETAAPTTGAAAPTTAATTGAAAAAAAESKSLAEVGAAPVLKDINALYTLLDDRYTKKFPLSGATIHPTSNPNHYDALVAELKEAPHLSWFQRTLRKIGGMVRFK